MSLEWIIANLEDLQRLRRLEEAGHFKKGFADYATHASERVLGRILALAVMYRFISYPGPTVTT